MNIVMINDLMREITTKGATIKDNVKISNGTSVNFENELKSLIKNDPSSVDYNFINNRPIFNDNSVVNDKFVNISNEDIITSLSEELVDNVNKLVDIVSPLVKSSYENNILKEDIIKAIKNKLEVLDIEDKDGNILKDNSLNITNQKPKELLDKTSYNVEIGVVNNYRMEVPIKERFLKDKIKTLNENNVNFKDIIKDKNSGINKVQYLNIDSATVKDSNVSEELENKLEKIQQSMKSNNEEEVIDEVVDLLNLLNINVVNNSSLPIIVDMPKSEEQLMPLVKGSYGDNMAKNDIIKVVKNEQKDLNIESKYVDSTTNLPQKAVENINKAIDEILPLLKDSYGDNILKDDIIKAIKNKLEAVDIEEIDTGNNFMKEVPIKDSNVSEELEKKLEKIQQSMQSNNEEKTIKEVVGLFNLLNINVVNNSSLPIIVDMPKSEEQLMPLVESKYVDTTNNLPQKAVENINKAIDEILPLLNNSYGGNILKDDIIKAIKKNIEAVDIEDIDIVNNFKKKSPIEDSLLKDKTKTLNVDNVNLKDVIKEKNLDINKVQYLNIDSDIVKDSNVSEELENKLEKIQQSMKSNNEEAVIKEVADLLNLLKINVVNNSSLPIIVDMPKSEEQLMPLVESKYVATTTNLPQKAVENINKAIDEILPLLKDSYGDNIPKDDIIKAIKNKLEAVDNEEIDTVNNFMKEVPIKDSLLKDKTKTLNVDNVNLKDVIKDKNYSDELLNLLGEDTTTNLTKESVENINKLIDTVLPLVKDSYGHNIKKDDIIKAIKSKLEYVNIKGQGGKRLEVNPLNITNLQTYKVDAENYLNKVETDELGNLNFKTTTGKELSKEDKILNRALGLETTDNFSQVMSRLNIRNDIQTEKTISSSTVFKDTMDEDIVKNIRFMIKNQVQELKVKIYPKELGEMTIKILSEEGIMRAEIKATSKETYHLLHSNINEIKNSLNNENIKIQEVNIGLYNDDTTYYSGQGYQEGSYNGNERYKDNNSSSVIKEYEEEIEEVINTDSSNVDLLV